MVKAVLNNNQDVLADIKYYAKKFPDIFGHKDVAELALGQLIEHHFTPPGKEKILRDLQHPDMINRLEAAFHAASYYGITYAYPLISPALCSWYLNLPDRMLLQAPKRNLYKKIISAWVPPEIVEQSKINFNMYGWVMDSYYFDFIHEIPFNSTSLDNMAKFMADVESLRDVQLYIKYFNIQYIK